MEVEGEVNIGKRRSSTFLYKSSPNNLVSIDEECLTMLLTGYLTDTWLFISLVEII
jgi:hypothetical protein